MGLFPFRLEKLPSSLIEVAVRRALDEDLGGVGDVTSIGVFGERAPSKRAFIVAKEAGVVCGLEVAVRTFALVDASLSVSVKVEDGNKVQRGGVIAHIEGNVASILKAERVALNFLGLMSGIATKTRRIVRLLEGTSMKILDTRKTLPGLRAFEKYAVAVGGGYNHRYGLYDMILIKENHRAAAGGIVPAVSRARMAFPDMLIEVEVSTIDEVKEALITSADILMLDNMNDEEIERALALIGRRKMVEASGNMTEERAVKLARLGVDFVSMGMLTHTVRPLDVSLLMEDFL